MYKVIRREYTLFPALWVGIVPPISRSGRDSGTSATVGQQFACTALDHLVVLPVFFERGSVEDVGEALFRNPTDRTVKPTTGIDRSISKHCQMGRAHTASIDDHSVGRLWLEQPFFEQE